MFTGIIEDLGIVKAFEKRQPCRLVVSSPIFKDQAPGRSVAVNGVCLTISELRGAAAAFDVMDETIKKSNLGTLKAGDRVNLERALQIGARLSGHFVTGHVDCIGTITEKDNAACSMTLRIPRDKTASIVPKGSIAVDGVSLTIGEICLDTFTVFLIPHTIENTNLKFKKTGGVLNIEFDIIGKYGSRPQAARITEDFLREHGFC